MKLFHLKPVLSFTKQGSSVGVLQYPWGVAVNARDEIAVTDFRNHRVQIFSSNGNYLRSLGRAGNKAGEFKVPAGITFIKNGNIFVADNGNHRIQIFSGEGKYVGMFGGKGTSLKLAPYYSSSACSADNKKRETTLYQAGFL